METSGAALRRTLAVSGARSLRDSCGSPLAGPSRARSGTRASVSAWPRGVSSASGGGGGVVFSDVGHLNYYALPVRCGGGRRRKEEEKKRAKLVKGLSRDLAELCTVGIGADAGQGLAGEVKGKMISEAAELLLAELKQLRAQEKEMKRKRKEEKAARMMKDCAKDESSSRSSSDSECDEVVRMSNLRTAAPKTREGIEHRIALKPAQECCSSSSITSEVGKPMNKIEVCMGGKCKRSGAAELLEELEKKIGIEGAVVGCKCMGKCRDGPNVRVLNHSNSDDAVRIPKNPLCIGVGLEDVGTIVTCFFEHGELGLMAAA